MITRFIRLVASAALLGTLTERLRAEPGGADAEAFERRVRPLFVEHCTGCHGAEKQEAGLRLDSREALLKGGETGPALVPGKPEESLLLAALRHREPAPKMPRKKPALPAATIEDVRQWIAAGAPWPGTAVAVSGGFNLEERKQRLPWLWQTPQRQVVPAGNGARPGSSSDLDAFLDERLRAEGLTGAPPADDLAWLRRVHFVLTGLPPSRETMQSFLADSTPGRRERVVAAGLASPHFGERWARHWMDVVRYAESRGHEDDYAIANAWRYRDYLIRTFNADVPYDRFVAEHVAGDLLSPRRHPVTGGNESVLATGWAFLGEEVHSPVDIRQDECERVDNKVDVLSKAFLGLTVACARCHDHKFDALTQRDYYALSGFVLGSPYRQVRFETMEAHARALNQLTELRTRHVGAVATGWAAALRPHLATTAAELLSAPRLLQGEAAEAVAAATGLNPNRLKLWAEQLKLAVSNPAHVWHRLAHVAARTEAERAALGSDPRFAVSPGALTLPAGATVLADFTRPAGSPWKTDGPAFGLRPRGVGEVLLGGPDQPLARVLPYGAASRDAFWNRLVLTPGTEMDSGSLGAAGRAGKTLLTPKATLASGRLHYLLRGRAQVYAGVDSHLMLTGPLHGSLIANFDTGDQLRWVTHELGAYAGHRLHLEFAPPGDAALDVLLVVEAPTVPTWLPVEPWWPKAAVSSFPALAEALQTELTAVVTALASGPATVPPHWAPLADWLVQNASRFGASATPAATDYLREQARLAAGIRWDSPTAVSWADGTGVDEQVLLRGKPTRPGAVAPRGLPEAFGLPRINPTDASGRAGLAVQLTDPANPLVARVLVNRVWHHVFGRGLVPTVDNFGFLGERPTHPELLDHLAWQFVHEDGWSVKRLLHRLLLTEAFARSSRTDDARAEELDPTNRWLHRMPVRRLEGEAIRDALLAVSGRLEPAQFGPPVPVHLTEFIVGRGRPATSGPLDGGGRRSLYLAVRRNFLPTMLLAFDLPTPFSTVGRRNVTNVPGQSLVLMNDPFVREQAAQWAARLLRELPAADWATRVAWMFETAFARPPAAAETQFAAESLAELRGLHAGAPEAVVWAEFGHALLNASEFIYLK
jgi:mono/diheme cytochrome c family protein